MAHPPLCQAPFLPNTQIPSSSAVHMGSLIHRPFTVTGSSLPEDGRWATGGGGFVAKRRQPVSGVADGNVHGPPMRPSSSAQASQHRQAFFLVWLLEHIVAQRPQKDEYIPNVFRALANNSSALMAYFFIELVFRSEKLRTIAVNFIRSARLSEVVRAALGSA